MICASDLRPKSQVVNLRVFVVNKGETSFPRSPERKRSEPESGKHSKGLAHRRRDALSRVHRTPLLSTTRSCDAVTAARPPQRLENTALAGPVHGAQRTRRLTECKAYGTPDRHLGDQDARRGCRPSARADHETIWLSPGQGTVASGLATKSWARLRTDRPVADST